MFKKIICMGIALMMCIGLFCACGNNPDQLTTSKAELLRAFDQLKASESYVEIIEISTAGDGIKNYTTKYKKSDNGFIAEVLEETFSETETRSLKYYFVDGYMYMPSPDLSEYGYGGVKISMQRDFISFSQFFNENSGYLTTEKINQLNKESNVKTETIKGNLVYSFNVKEIFNMQETKYSINNDYRVAVDADQRIIEIRQTKTGAGSDYVIVASYNYVSVEIKLPDDLDTYFENKG